MNKPKNIPPSKNPPPAEETDRQLKELINRSQETTNKYFKHLNSLHKLFKKEPTLSPEDQYEIMNRLRATVYGYQQSDKKDLFSRIKRILKIRILPLLSARYKLRIQREINMILLEYIENSNRAKSEFDKFKNKFHSELLQYTQQVGPFVHDLHSEISRKVTVFPIERMDIIFTDLMRQMEQLRTDIERIKKKIEKK
jgi:hypothetical protein